MASGKIAEFFHLTSRKTAPAVTPAIHAVPGREQIKTEERACVEQCLELQKKHGLGTDSTRHELLKCFLRESCIDVFPIDKVTAYMDAQFGGAGWRWYRAQVSETRLNDRWGSRVALYDMPVPLPVLLRIDQIMAKFPDAMFEIAAKGREHPVDADPFLSVRLSASQERIVIERWDEPGFRS